MKRTVTTRFGLLVAMLLTILPMSAYDFEVDGVYYDVISFTDLTCKVVKGDDKYKGDVVIPSEVVYNTKALSVTEIDWYAFSGCSSLTSVVIPDSVTEIDADAFSGCSSLSSVVIPDSVTEIGSEAFRGCSSLTSVVIPDSVTEIGLGAFSGCSSLTSVVIPDSVTEIGLWAFSECSSLTSVVIPDSVTEIGPEAFSGCSSLTSVVMPDSVTEIGPKAFSGCSSLSSVVIPDSVTEIGLGAFSGCSSLTSVVIPDSVTEIGWRAFSGCSSLTEIRLSNSIMQLWYGTFEDCVALQSIIIPGNVRELIQYYQEHSQDSQFLFENCSNLKALRLEYGNNILEGCYYCCYEVYVVGEGNKKIHEIKTTEIDFLSNINEALHLEKVFIDRELSNSLKLPYLKELTLGEHVAKVQIIPSQSESLETIECYAVEPPICPEFTNAQYMNVVVKVPNVALDAYQNADGWKNFWNLQGFDSSGVDEVVSDENVYEIGRYDLNGKPVTSNYEGITVIRYSNGTTRKVITRQ